jgi:hypothetical protein
VLVYPESDARVTKTQAEQSFLSLNRDRSKGDRVAKTTQNQGSLSPNRQNSHTGNLSTTVSMPLKVGDCIEILTGYFAGRHAEVIGFPRDKPDWADVKGKDWAITHQYQRGDLRLIGRTQG